TVTVAYTGWLEDETIFDSSIVGWEEKGITKDTEFNDDQDQRLLTFKVGSGQVISGFDDAVIGLKINQTKTIDISPDKAYGLDPKAHPLGNESLNFKIKIIKIE
ncbi:MAG: FKBP-type peptidyl-prolyl cis-trans isomerase, partial [Nanoarchaeota archaeon]